jgi:PPM family protein phosphatase
VQEVLTQAVEKANDAILALIPELDGGTTLTIALIIGRRLHVAHVGDSRAYLLRDDQLEQITDDHSLVRRLQDVGQLPSDDEILYNMRHVLLRAVGQGDELEVDTYTLRLPSQGPTAAVQRWSVRHDYRC